MKLAFSTLGCPGWSWDEIYATAKDLGMDGIEVRGIGDEMYAPQTTPFKPENYDKTVKSMVKAGMVFSMLATACGIGNKDHSVNNMKEVCDYIDTASRFDCRYVRVMAEDSAKPSGNFDFDFSVKMYGEILDYAADKNVFPLIETNGTLADSDLMAGFIKKVNRKKRICAVGHPSSLPLF